MSAVLTRDLFLVRDQERQALKERTREALLAWAKEWLPNAGAWSPALEVSCSTESQAESPSGTWLAFGKAGGQKAEAWSQVSEAAQARLASLLVARESTAPLAETDWAVQAASAALVDLHGRLLGAVVTADADQPDLKPLSGAIVVREKTLGATWVWSRGAYASAKAATSALAAKGAPGVAALTDGLGQQRVVVSAGLGEVEIPVADLLALQIGDVIRFPATLKGQVPLSIGSSDERQHAAQVQLGQLDGHVAVKLVSKHSAA